MLKDIVWEGELRPVINSALNGDANIHTGNNDGIVSAMEIINYTNNEWSAKLGGGGLHLNDIKFVLYSSEDLPVTIIE